MTADEQMERWELEAAAARKERRERIATAVLAGFTSVPLPAEVSLAEALMFDTQRAVEYANALITELDKQP